MPKAAAPDPRSASSRRTVLRLGGSAVTAAGVAMLAGCSSSTAQAGPQALGSTAPSDASGGPDPPVRHFHSRPDLRPARAVISHGPGTAATAGVILLDSHGGIGQQGPMILDRAGELVWFRPLSAHASADHRAFNLRVQQYQGEPTLTWWQGNVVQGHGEGHYVLANSRYEQTATVHGHGGYQGDLHEFLLTGTGTALFTCYGAARADLRSLGGSASNPYFYGVIQEVDLATGRLLFQWRSDRHIPFSHSYAPLTLHQAAPWDQFHINSINVAPDGNLIVSARNTWTVYKVHRRTGRVMWRMGGKHSDFTMGRRTRFAWQHHVTPHPGGLYTVFDNESGDYKVGRRSRGLVLRVDEARRHVSFVRQYDPPAAVLSPALGSVQPLPGGHVFVGWGWQPYFTEYTQDGSVVFSGRLDGKHTHDYRAFKSAWTGRPAQRPRLAASRHGGETRAYVSWNGDTQVRHWALLAGPSAGRLAVAARVPRQGFESTIRTQHAGPYVAAAGYDGDGRELGRTAVHQL